MLPAAKLRVLKRCAHGAGEQGMKRGGKTFPASARNIGVRAAF
jgi:hypothetical protein